MSNTNSSRVGSVLAFAASILIVSAAVWLFFNRQLAIDQLSVWTYSPSQGVARIEERVDFTPRGKFIFYATKPVLAEQAHFNEECPRQEAGSPILGCYTNNDQIYLYDITNQKLDGMEEVTAAHEMLHAVWTRTSPAERERLTVELRNAYESLNDPALKSRMDYYERTEPGEFANELHSILGSEQPNLSDSLERYYGRFFNRATLLKLHQQYSEVYSALYTRSDTLYAQMTELSESIQARSAAYETKSAQLSADITSFNARARGNWFSSQAQFSAERSALVARSRALDTERDSINASITTYDTYYNEYVDIAQQIEVLNNSVDSFKPIEQAPSV